MCIFCHSVIWFVHEIVIAYIHVGYVVLELDYELCKDPFGGLLSCMTLCSCTFKGLTGIKFEALALVLQEPNRRYPRFVLTRSFGVSQKTVIWRKGRQLVRRMLEVQYLTQQRCGGYGTSDERTGWRFTRRVWHDTAVNDQLVIKESGERGPDMFNGGQRPEKKYFIHFHVKCNNPFSFEPWHCFATADSPSGPGQGWTVQAWLIRGDPFG